MTYLRHGDEIVGCSAGQRWVLAEVKARAPHARFKNNTLERLLAWKRYFPFD